MRDPEIPADAPDLAVLSTALARARRFEDVVLAAEEGIQAAFQPAAFSITWISAESASVITRRGNLPELDDVGPAQLTEEIEHRRGVTIVPLIVGGMLYGTVRMITVHSVTEQAVAYFAQLAALLALFSAPTSALSRETLLLNEVGRLVRSTLALPVLLASLTEVVCRTIDAPEFSVALLDDVSGLLTVAYARQPQGVSLPDKPWSPDEGLTGIVFRNVQPVRTDDYVRACAEHGVAPIMLPYADPPRAWLGVPLVHKERTIGVMLAWTREPQTQYTDADEHFMVMVASQAATAVANAQLYMQVERQAQQLRLINRIGRAISRTLDPRRIPMLLAHELRQVIDVDDIVVLVETSSSEFEIRYDLADPGITGHTIPHGTSLASQALTSGRILHVDSEDGTEWAVPEIDSAGRIESVCVICAPIQNQEVRGALTLRNKRGGHFDGGDIELLMAIAEQVAIALANAERHSETDEALARQIQALGERNEQLTQLVALGNALQTQDNLLALANEVVSTTTRLTSCTRVMIALVDRERQRVIPAAVAGFGPRTSGYLKHSFSLSTIATILANSPAIAAQTYHVGERADLPEFEDLVILTIRDRQGILLGITAIDTCERVEPFSAGIIQALEIVANQAAIAITNVSLYQEQQQTVDRLTALNALSLAVNTAQLDIHHVMQMTVSGAVGTTGSAGGGAVVLNSRGEAQEAYTLHFPQGLVEDVQAVLPRVDSDYVELRRNSLPSTARDANIRRLIVVPMRGAKLTVGALWLGFTQPTITQAEREMAVLYGKMAGAVIENLSLFTEMRAAEERKASILASTREGILMVDPDRRISVVNSAFGELLGLAPSHLTGMTIDQLDEDPSILGIDKIHSAAIHAAFSAVLQGSSEQFVGEFVVTGAVHLDIAWTVLKAHGDAGGPTGAILVAHDVTADRQMEKLRADMSNMIVHDLRSPLTNLTISIELLLKQMQGPLSPEQLRILQIAAGSCQQMLDLVNDLLDIRRLEAKTMTVERQPTPLEPIAEIVIERVETIAVERHVVIVNELHALPLVLVDMELIRRVLQNLVDNALKFSPPRGRIVLSGRVVSASSLPFSHAAGTWVVAAVQDEGSGIPEAYRTKIFELFAQAPAGYGHGSGLGLAFCKLAVEAHGGTIWVESAVDQGSTFYLTLPVAPSFGGLA